MDSINALILDLQHPNRYIRREAFDGLRRIGSSVIKPLLPFLHTPDPEVRSSVIAILSMIPHPDGVSALIALLKQRTQQRGWSKERFKIAQGLSSIDLPEAQEVAFAFFADRLQHAVSEERQDALAYLIDFPYPEAEALVRQALNDPDPDVRRTAAYRLKDKERGRRSRFIQHEIPPLTAVQPKPIQPLSDLLLERLGDVLDEDTIEALGKSGESHAVTALLAALSQCDPGAPNDATFSLRLSIVRALGDLGDPRSLPTLRSLVRTDTRALDAWGVGVNLSIAEIAQDVIEKIEWRMHKLGLIIPLPEAANDTWNADGTLELPDELFAFPTLLKLAPNHPRIQAAFQLFNEAPRIKEYPSLSRQDCYHSFPAHGVSFLFWHDELATIFIFVRPTADYAAWAYPLPHALHQTMNRTQVRLRLGHPESASSRYAGPHGFDRWIFVDHGFRVSYTANGATLSEIMISDMATFP